jgi:subfamily B ATP-binding cassette protein MsbA
LLAIILVAMLVETAMGLAGPWPLKIVIDSVVGHHPLPHWIVAALGPGIADHKLALAGAAAAGVVLIALLGAIASYTDNYYTESVGQYASSRATSGSVSTTTSTGFPSPTTTRGRPETC